MMLEGDKAVDDWQTWEDWSPEPKEPVGFKQRGPWYPFAVVAMPHGDGATALVVVYRRPLRKVEEHKP